MLAMEKGGLGFFEVKAGECLLIGGPAHLRVSEGRVEALGVELTKGGRAVVRVFKALPVKALENSLLEIKYGVNGFVEKMDEPYPSSWLNVIEEALKLKGTVIVMGGVDVGKSTLCTLITNIALLKGLKVAVIEGDVGQAEIGPPTTVSLAIPKRPSPDLFRQNPVASEFIGSTSPMGFEDEVVEALAKLKTKAEAYGVDMVVVNTDGWVEDGKAVEYKVGLADVLKPSLIALLCRKDELEDLRRRLMERFNVLIVQPLPNARRRDRGARKELRELSYQKNLRGSGLRSIPVSWVKIHNHDLGTGVVLSEERFRILNEKLNGGLVYGEETPNGLLLVLNDRLVSEDDVRKIFENYSRPVNVIWKGSEKGLIVGLYDRRGEFMGIGVIGEVDYGRRVLKIHTPCQKPIGIIKLGYVKLVGSWKEVEKFRRCPLEPKRINPSERG
ncbi:hypothetical protein DRO58_01075 [Candidatus Bathyarchaeota archaeon]|nr:MAG: hypothetical protein DRO58_01075 [Candidatus Bathyarchaeota archaeon]